MTQSVLQLTESSSRWLVTTMITMLALLRHSFNLLVLAVAASAFVLAILACIQSMGVLKVPHIGLYLARVPIDVSVTLLGILIAVFTAARTWRSQKRDELLLASLGDIEKFFEGAMHTAIVINGYTLLLKELQFEANAGPCALTSLWRAKYLADQAIDIQERKKQLSAFGTEVHTLDSRNIHTLASNPMVFISFKKAKAAVLALADSSYFSVPNPSGDPYDFIAMLRLLPENEFDTYLLNFDRLNQQAGGGLGGLRGAIQAKFFPPTLTFAWALMRSKNDP